MELARIIGIIGLLLITWGIFAKDEIQQDKIFIAGGIALFIYSYWLGDTVFMTLQVVFTGASLLELWQLTRKQKKTIFYRMKSLFRK